MKPKNDKDVRNGIVRFMVYFMASVFCATCIFSTFMKTSSVEVSKIIEKNSEYDKVQQKQVALAEKVDSIYYYANMLNSGSNSASATVRLSLDKRVLSLVAQTNNMSDGDAGLYKRLAKDLPVIFSIKDSIRKMTYEEDKYRAELMRCITQSRTTMIRDALSSSAPKR